MARPIKNNADYFTHDADMRDDPKVKALRRKFKVFGYGIWCMLLEVISDSDNFRLNYDPEIISGDFDVDPEQLEDVVNYCIKLGLLTMDGDTSKLYSKTLDKRFESLLSKRKRERSELSSPIIPDITVIDIESTQSRVEESKEEKSKGLVYDLTSNPNGLFIAVKDGTKIMIKIHQQSFEKWLDGSFPGAYEGQKMSIQTRPPIEEFFRKNNGNIYNDNGHVWSAFKKLWLAQAAPKPNQGKIQ